MKRKLLALFLALCLLLCASPLSYAATGQEQYDMLKQISEFIRQNGLESSTEDDPLGAVLIQLLEKDPLLYEQLLTQMLARYDSHTMYVPAGSYSQTFPTGEETYVGVGVTLEAHEQGAKIIGVNASGTAYAAGIRTDDVITAVNGAQIGGKTLAQVAALLRGPAGSYVDLTILRGAETLRFVVSRAPVVTYNYSGYPLEDGIFYMRWSAISDDGSYLLFRKDLLAMEARGDACLILDLRNNPGGSLDLAFSMISDLLPEKTAFFRTASRNPDTDELEYEYVISDGNGLSLKKILVLVNGATASAAEVITAALTDTGYALSVGQTTYGKARAQYHVPLGDDAALVLTGMKLLSLKQGDYERIGLKPDVAVTNQTAPAGAESAALSLLPLAKGSCSDNGAALNLALMELGYLHRNLEKPYQLGDDTQSALNLLCDDYGLTCRNAGAATELLRLVNDLLTKKSAGSYVQDDQLTEAVRLARQYAAN